MGSAGMPRAGVHLDWENVIFLFLELQHPCMLEASASAVIFTLSRDVTKASSNID